MIAIRGFLMHQPMTLLKEAFARPKSLTNVKIRPAAKAPMITASKTARKLGREKGFRMSASSPYSLANLKDD